MLAGFPHDAHAAHTSVGNAFRIAKPLVLVDRSVRFRERIRIAAFISETIGAQRMDTSFEMRISGFSNLRLQRVEQRSSACVVADADGLDQAIPSLEYERTADGLQHVDRFFIALRRITKPTCSAAGRRERQQRLLHRSRRSLNGIDDIDRKTVSGQLCQRGGDRSCVIESLRRRLPGPPRQQFILEILLRCHLERRDEARHLTGRFPGKLRPKTRPLRGGSHRRRALQAVKMLASFDGPL